MALVLEQIEKPRQKSQTIFLEEPNKSIDEMSISEIFELADKELTQIRGDYGSRSQKTACASGVLVYYLGTGYSPEYGPDYLFDSVATVYRRDVYRFRNAIAESYGSNIETLNDKYFWSFGEFAQAARELGF